MRQRRVKNEKERVLSYSEHHLVAEPEKNKDKWHNYFDHDGEIHIEIGCGKGGFITTLAEINPEIKYIAIEPIGTIILRALEKAHAKDLDNTAFVWKFADNIQDYIGENEVDKIYLNFSDPWPKERHAKRRLTHRNFLKQYQHILKPKGSIEFKTDNTDLFEFSLDEFEACGFTLKIISRDLHSTDISNVRTEYEQKFTNRGISINYCKAILDE